MDVESTKRGSRHLRGEILEEIALPGPEFSKQTVQILKFHGTYQQTDRDARKQGVTEYGSMVRVSVPGGILTAEQYLLLDRLADEVGDGSLRVTSRQDVQFHRVEKADLRRLMATLNAGLLTTLAACGDVVRNVICCPAPWQGGRRNELEGVVRSLARRFKPQTRAYYEIWIAGEKAAAAESAEEVEPLYGAAYLPRKFKIGFALPEDNCIDVYTNDVGIVPVYAEERLAAFTILAGGGLGMSAGVKATHPRLADPLTTVAPEELERVVEAIVTVHRDYGNRANRKLARLKYLIEEWGLERFRAEVEARVGSKLDAPRPLEWTSGQDHLGWHPQGDGSYFLGIRVESGRVRGAVRDCLRELARLGGVGIRLSAQQNVLVAGVGADARGEAEAVLRAHGIALPAALPTVTREAMACPALPTCGLAITEAERVLPELAAEIQARLAAAGLAREPVTVRVTGCPNGCARPYTAEIGIVGQSVNLYGVYLGGSHLGTRLGFLFAANVPQGRIGATLEPVFELFRASRAPGERFGDFCDRIGVEGLRAAPANLAGSNRAAW